MIFFINPQKIIAEDDKELWNSIGIKTKLPNSLELELEQSLRFKDQMSSFKQTLPADDSLISIFIVSISHIEALVTKVIVFKHL